MIKRLIYLIIITLVIGIGAIFLEKYISDDKANQLQELPTENLASEKELIDQWILENDLNQYGDPKDALYSGGTPLFNESTGQYIDRYEYILESHPDKPWIKN